MRNGIKGIDNRIVSYNIGYLSYNIDTVRVAYCEPPGDKKYVHNRGTVLHFKRT